MCTYINEYLHKSNKHRHMYTYVHMTPYSCTHTLTDTEDPELFSAEASLLWDKEDRVQTL